MEFGNLSPTRQLQGGERFLLVLERHVPFFGMARIDTLAGAWDNVGKSQFFYTVSPSREAITVSDQKVGALTVRTRLEAAKVSVSVGTAMDDLQQHLGFMRIRRVDAVDGKDATSVEVAAEAVQAERAKGAGQSTVTKALGTVGEIGKKAGDVFGEAFGLIKLVLIVAAVGGVAYVLVTVRKAT